MSKEINVPVVIVGAGPKGLATAVALQEHYPADDVPILEVKRVGGTWSHETLNPSRRMHKAGWEIVSDPSRTYGAYSEMRGRPLENLDPAPTFANYGSYLRWLGNSINVTNSGANHISYDSKVLRVHTEGRVYKPKAIVLTTGLSGVGNAEFTHDPTGLRQDSDLVVHTPTDIRTRKETLDFVRGVKSVAVIGAGVAGSFAIDDLTYSDVQQIHHIGAEGFKVSDVSPWIADNSPVSSTTIYNDQRARLLGDRLHTHIGRRIKTARMVGARVELIDDDNKSIEVEKVILATGYRYDISKVPCLTPLVKAGLIRVDGNYPQIDENYRLHSDPVLYGHGEIAVPRGPEQRFLASTIPTLAMLVPALLSEITSPEV